jgi:3-hydroxyisobutyrate dehydrogenase-like beta-hydroxyacid dehydrogenase
VARTRQAAADGTLRITVYELHERIRPLLAHLASEITLCGDAGSGQTVKLMNNMALMQTVLALVQASGVDTTAAKHAQAFYARSAEAGNADRYYPAVLNLINPPD